MNVKQEFINSIMGVLRLDKNVFTAGAIEHIIERLDIKDYSMFIAYLGERTGEYERPLETLANAVNEYYEIKLEPYKAKAQEMSKKITKAFKNMSDFFRENAILSEEQIQKIEETAKKDYGKQGKERVDENIRDQSRAKLFNVGRENNIKFIRDIELNNDLINRPKLGDESLFRKEMQTVIFAIGKEKATDSTLIERAVQEYYLKPIKKPSIKEKILIAEQKITGFEIEYKKPIEHFFA